MLLVCVKPKVQLDSVSVSKSQNKFFENKPRIIGEAEKVALHLASKMEETWAVSVTEQPEILREALARDATQAHCIQQNVTEPSEIVSYLLSFCKEHLPTTILCGLDSQERMIGEIPARLAVALGWEYAVLAQGETLRPQIVYGVPSSLMQPPLPSALKIMKSAKAQVFMHVYDKKSQELYLRKRVYVPE
jgi:electron transfer flavoprotein alpha/beta subunit